MIERLLLALLLIALGWLAYRSATRLVLTWRARKGLMLEEYQAGRPAVLYFTAPSCLPCKTVQRPALEALQARYGERLQIIEVDATQRPRLADAWGVLSVPTTFIIDAQGRPRRVNHGVARTERLIEQLMAVGEPPPEPRGAAVPARRIADP